MFKSCPTHLMLCFPGSSRRSCSRATRPSSSVVSEDHRGGHVQELPDPPHALLPRIIEEVMFKGCPTHLMRCFPGSSRRSCSRAARPPSARSSELFQKNRWNQGKYIIIICSWGCIIDNPAAYLEVNDKLSYCKKKKSISTPPPLLVFIICLCIYPPQGEDGEDHQRPLWVRSPRGSSLRRRRLDHGQRHSKGKRNITEEYKSVCMSVCILYIDPNICIRYEVRYFFT